MNVSQLGLLALLSLFTIGSRGRAEPGGAIVPPDARAAFGSSRDLPAKKVPRPAAAGEKTKVSAQAKSVAKANREMEFRKMEQMADDKERLAKDTLAEAQESKQLLDRNRQYLAKVRTDPTYPKSVGAAPLSSAQLEAKEKELEAEEVKINLQMETGQKLLHEAAELRREADRQAASSDPN
jgi:hypothetical protein